MTFLICRNGAVDEFRQPPVPKSAYQARLEAEAAEDAESEENSSTSDIRYWSDYNRVYFHPRTLQRLPNLSDYENVEGDWNVGKDAFTKWDEVSSGCLCDVFTVLIIRSGNRSHGRLVPLPHGRVRQHARAANHQRQLIVRIVYQLVFNRIP